MAYGFASGLPNMSAITIRRAREPGIPVLRAAEREGLFTELYPTRIGDYVLGGDGYIPAENFAVRARCDAPLATAVVRYDGEARLCCNFGAAAGNAADRRFLELWGSRRYDELRQAVNDLETMPKPCRGCRWANRREKQA